MYVLGILGAIMAGSYFLTGGLTPDIQQVPDNPEIVQIDPSKISSDQDTLQLINLEPLSPSPTPSPTPTPTPLPSVSPSPTTTQPTPTDVPEECLDKTVLTLILDVSTSMNSGGKMSALNSAMSKFVSGFKNSMVVGAVQFAGPASFSNSSSSLEGTNTLLSYTKYGSNSSLVRSRLTSLSTKTTSPTDGTYMRNAFRRSISNINSVKSTYANQGYQFVTVLFTDGVPETQYYDGNCVVYYPPGTYSLLCFAKAQDPRTDLTTSLKSASDKVYAIGLYTGGREKQALSESRKLLSTIVSNSNYDADISSTSQLTALFDNILSSACQ